MSEPQRLGELLPGVMSEIDRRRKAAEHRQRIDNAKLLLRDIPADSPLVHRIWKEEPVLADCTL